MKKISTSVSYFVYASMANFGRSWMAPNFFCRFGSTLAMYSLSGIFILRNSRLESFCCVSAPRNGFPLPCGFGSLFLDVRNRHLMWFPIDHSWERKNSRSLVLLRKGSRSLRTPWSILSLAGILETNYVFRRVLSCNRQVSMRHKIRRLWLRHRRTFIWSAFLVSFWHDTVLSVWKKRLAR